MYMQNPYGRGANVASALADVSNSLKGMMKDEMDSRRIERKMKLDEMMQEANIRKIEMEGKRDKMAGDIALSRLQYQDALDTKKLGLRQKEFEGLQDYRLKQLASRDQERRDSRVGIMARAAESDARRRQVERNITPIAPTDYFGKRSGQIAQSLFGSTPRTREEWSDITSKNAMFQNIISKIGLEDLYKQVVASGDVKSAAQIKQFMDQAETGTSRWIKKGGIETAVAEYTKKLAGEGYAADEILKEADTYRKGIEKIIKGDYGPPSQKKEATTESKPATPEQLESLRELVLKFNEHGFSLKAKDIKNKIKEVGVDKTIEFLMGRYNSLQGKPRVAPAQIPTSPKDAQGDMSNIGRSLLRKSGLGQ